ncbi:MULTISPECIES: hypothetical protein, partial [unclassified Mesorhizobium]|uniref:hypothetical protein n=1 Tax=unclassified Mesorhizobium TaxID=325217 RepID=UPI001AEEAFAD
NLKVTGSNPVPATKSKNGPHPRGPFCVYDRRTDPKGKASPGRIIQPTSTRIGALVMALLASWNHEPRPTRTSK